MEEHNAAVAAYQSKYSTFDSKKCLKNCNVHTGINGLQSKFILSKDNVTTIDSKCGIYGCSVGRLENGVLKFSSGRSMSNPYSIYDGPELFYFEMPGATDSPIKYGDKVILMSAKNAGATMSGGTFIVEQKDGKSSSDEVKYNDRVTLIHQRESKNSKGPKLSPLDVYIRPPVMNDKDCNYLLCDKMISAEVI